MAYPKDALCQRDGNLHKEQSGCPYFNSADGSCSIARRIEQSVEPGKKKPRLPMHCTALAITQHLRGHEASKRHWRPHTAAD